MAVPCIGARWFPDLNEPPDTPVNSTPEDEWPAPFKASLPRSLANNGVKTVPSSTLDEYETTLPR